jgi:hypothetical protein
LAARVTTKAFATAPFHAERRLSSEECGGSDVLKLAKKLRIGAKSVFLQNEPS